MTSSANRTPEERAKARRDFMRRLSYYLIGVAIGLVLLGMFQVRRQSEARQREARRQAAEQVQSPDSVEKTAPQPPR